MKRRLTSTLLNVRGGLPREPRRAKATKSRWARAGLAPVLVTCCGLIVSLCVSGCSPEKAEVEEVAWQFVEAIKHQDTETLERIIDWELYYAQSTAVAEEEGEEGEPLDTEYQKELLLRVISRDRGMALTYLTAENSMENVAVKGDEATARILQVDRATGEERVVALQLKKTGNEGWKVYNFNTER